MNNIDNKKKYANLTIAILSVALYVLFCLVEHFNYHCLPDTPNQKSNSLAYLIIFLIFGGMYLIGYILNLFIFKKSNIYKVMNIISSGCAMFFAVGSIIALLATMEEWDFDVNNVSLFVNASFTLLGFGLTVVAILSQVVFKRIKEAFKQKKYENRLLDFIIPYFLLLILGLVSSISVLLNIQFSGTLFYKATVLRALFYSSAQVIALVIELVVVFVTYLLENVK